jgi:hypothetical protein
VATADRAASSIGHCSAGAASKPHGPSCRIVHTEFAQHHIAHRLSRLARDTPKDTTLAGRQRVPPRTHSTRRRGGASAAAHTRGCRLGLFVVEDCSENDETDCDQLEGGHALLRVLLVAKGDGRGEEEEGSFDTHQQARRRAPLQLAHDKPRRVMHGIVDQVHAIQEEYESRPATDRGDLLRDEAVPVRYGVEDDPQRVMPRPYMPDQKQSSVPSMR